VLLVLVTAVVLLARRIAGRPVLGLASGVSS